MSYEPTEWIEGVTPVSPGNMNKIENGIKGAHDALEGMIVVKVSAAEPSPVKSNDIWFKVV